MKIFGTIKSASKLNLEGSGKKSVSQAQARVGLAMLVVLAAYSMVMMRLVYFGLTEPDRNIVQLKKDVAITATRPDMMGSPC